MKQKIVACPISDFSILVYFCCHRLIKIAVTQIKSMRLLRNQSTYWRLNNFAVIHIFFSRIQIFSFLFSSILYIKQKYWYRENFWLPVLDWFTCFGASWRRFHYFYKMSICLWQKFCGRTILKNCWTELNEILYLVASSHKLVLIRFWCILF